ncbi:MAG: AtpZ/AtpI family protein [Candidatus Nealsonbacteria bacterium]|nr:AtpZ/AtpI family protein [Candidatus Nealsonbacteria bacterium]
MAKETEIKKQKSRQALYGAIGLAWELGYTITVPLVIFAILGRFLDKKYDASPIFLLSGILLSIVVSGLLVFRKTKKILDDASKQ